MIAFSNGLDAESNVSKSTTRQSWTTIIWHWFRNYRYIDLTQFRLHLHLVCLLGCMVVVDNTNQKILA